MSLYNVKLSRYKFKKPRTFYKLFQRDSNGNLFDWNTATTMYQKPYVWDESLGKQFDSQTGFCALTHKNKALRVATSSDTYHNKTMILARIKVASEDITGVGVLWWGPDQFYCTIMTRRFEILSTTEITGN